MSPKVKKKRVPPPPRKGPRGPNDRHVSVSGADLGDGHREDVRVTISPVSGFVTIRVFHSKKKRWSLPLREAVELLARRAQVREANMRIGAH